MKIAVVGCGAVGSYYGACLARAGYDTHFLARSDYEAIRRKGISIRSSLGDFSVSPPCAREPKEIGVADWVLIALKTTANQQFDLLLPPLVGPDTAVVTLQNGLGNEERLARLFSPRQILGGLCFVCLNRVEPGVICHFDHGRIVLGEFQRPAEPRTRELAAMFTHAGVQCSVTDNLEAAHWEKLVWNIPFNGLGVAASVGYDAFARLLETMEPIAPPHSAGARASEVLELSRPRGPCLPTDRLLGDPHWATLVRELMLEIITAAGALGFTIPETLADKMMERTRTMGAYRASTLIDFERGKPLELEGLFLEPWRRARQAGVATPRLAALCAVLEALEEQRP